jgi:hypothetical protein
VARTERVDHGPRERAGMVDRRFTEVDLRRMLGAANLYQRDVMEGRWLIDTVHRRHHWQVIDRHRPAVDQFLRDCLISDAHPARRRSRLGCQSIHAEPSGFSPRVRFPAILPDNIPAHPRPLIASARGRRVQRLTSPPTARPFMSTSGRIREPSATNPIPESGFGPLARIPAGFLWAGTSGSAPRSRRCPAVEISSRLS